MIDPNGDRVDVTILTLMARHPRAEFMRALREAGSRIALARQLKLRDESVQALCWAYGLNRGQRGRPKKVPA